VIWKAVRHSLVTELFMWILVLVLAGLVSGLGFHFSIPSTAYHLAMFVVFVWIYRIVSSRLSILQSESEPEIDIYFQRGMSLKGALVSNAR